MKRFFKLFCMMLLVLTGLASCLNDNDTSVDTYSDTAITAVTLGTLNRYTHTISSNTGNDTIVRTTLTGSTYKLTIDQLGRKIFNRDSLPLGTDLKHVVLSAVSTKNNGIAFIKSLISDTLFYINTTDSLDFSQPRTIRVFSSNGNDYRDYTMTLSASATTGITFGWQLVMKDDDLAGWTDKHLVTIGDSVYFVDRDYISVYSPAQQRRILVKASDEMPITQLIGATDHEAFALGTDGRLKVSTDGEGEVWRDDELDDSPALLPTEAIAMTSWKYAPADSMDYVLLIGNSAADDTNAVLWRKLSRYHDYGQPTDGKWVYMPVDGNNPYALPRQDYLSITYYNNNVLAVGSNMKLYQSRDQGITWKTSSTYALPSQIGGTRATIAADKLERLWLVTDNGEVWMGTLR